MSKNTECQAHLDALRREHREVAGTLLSTMDGFEVAASVGTQISPKKMAAMTSSLLALGEAVSRESSVGQCRDLVIESSAGLVLMMDVPSTTHRSVLTVLCTEAAVLGRVRWAARNAHHPAGGREARPVHLPGARQDQVEPGAGATLLPGTRADAHAVTHNACSHGVSAIGALHAVSVPDPVASGGSRNGFVSAIVNWRT